MVQTVNNHLVSVFTSLKLRQVQRHICVLESALN